MSTTEQRAEATTATGPGTDVKIPEVFTAEFASEPPREGITSEPDPPVPLPSGPRAYLQRFQRLTGVIGMLFLIAGLAIWRFKPHSQDRLALIVLVCAMFLAILHHYSIEEGVKFNVKSEAAP